MKDGENHGADDYTSNTIVTRSRVEMHEDVSGTYRGKPNVVKKKVENRDRSGQGTPS